MIKAELTSEFNKSGNLDIPASLRALLDEATRFVQTQFDAKAHQAAVSFSGKGLDRRRLIRVLDFIETNLENDLDLDRMASVACLSRFHFSRKFKQAVGCSPLRYVSKRRFERAKALLSQGDRSLIDIALSFRFSSQANFTRAFKRATGLAPGQYRQQFGWRKGVSIAEAVVW
ncbi:helix-turn-helix domain-containing protein [Afipia sp. DC4300-2b1]|uniref:helix-turn-helix domain-containing protein n=1 Tax=Afipia sp. DC4300-2b1 TaxID=2804672 RepID=UPI003CED9C74